VNGRELALSYLDRARKRRAAIAALLEEEAYADVVREAQETVELVLKGVLRFAGMEPPKRHDVSRALQQQQARFPAFLREAMDDIVKSSGELAEQRSRAFYGDEERSIPASQLFGKDEAEQAVAAAERLLALFEKLVATAEKS
jgi:HEPN domain-containing protein